MFEQAFKNIDDVLWKEDGCGTELDYTEQSSWLLFLKYLDGLEQDKATEARLDRKKYAYILEEPYRWESWAAPRGKDGAIDHNKAKTGKDLVEFVDGKLFPYLQGFKQRASGPDISGCQKSLLKITRFLCLRLVSSGASSTSSIKRLTASSPPKPTPKRTSKTPAHYPMVICSLFLRNEGGIGKIKRSENWRHSETASISRSRVVAKPSRYWV